MSKTFFKNFDGELKWVRTDVPDEYMDQVFWKATIAMDEESLAAFKEIPNLRTKIKDGNEVTFRCPVTKEFNGEVVEYEIPVEIWSEEQNEYVELKERVGNGSRGRVNVEFYQYNYKGSPGTGCRLRGITVYKLEPVPTSTKVSKGTTDSAKADAEVTPWG